MDDVGFGAAILGDDDYELWLTVDTRVAVLSSLEGVTRSECMPPEFCGTMAPVLWTDSHIPMGDGWHLNRFVHEEVVERHGAVIWGRSDREIVGPQGIPMPVFWAWDEQQRLVCISAPIAREEPTASAATAGAPLEAMAEAQGEP